MLRDLLKRELRAVSEASSAHAFCRADRGTSTASRLTPYAGLIELLQSSSSSPAGSTLKGKDFFKPSAGSPSATPEKTLLKQPFETKLFRIPCRGGYPLDLGTDSPFSRNPFSVRLRRERKL